MGASPQNAASLQMENHTSNGGREFHFQGTSSGVLRRGSAGGVPMLRSAVLLACAALLAPAGIAQTRLEATDIANRPFSADFAAGGKLHLRVRSAEVRIIGTAENKISVELSGRGAHDARKLKVRF